jgi:hypothetical protein
VSQQISGLCACGCGGHPWISTVNNPKLGWVKGRPVRFVHGHWNRIENAPNWKGDEATKKTKSKRAIRWFDIAGKTCEDCGLSARDRHHKDENTGNNEPSNIALLCHRCHMKRHVLLGKPLPPRTALSVLRPCIICKKMAKPLRKGRCGACNEYRRNHGIERPLNVKFKRNRPACHSYKHNGFKPCPSKEVLTH